MAPTDPPADGVGNVWRQVARKCRFHLGKVKGLGDWRDFFLVLAALLYAAGYAMWGLHAWRSNLGRLPVLEIQYVLAGVPLAIATALLMFLLVLLKESRQAIASFNEKRRKVTAPLAFVFYFGALVLALAAGPKRIGWWPDEWRIAIEPMLSQLLSLISMGLSLLFLPFDTMRSLKGWMNPMNQTLVMVAVLFFYYYASSLYPSIPQAWGGVAPRCAELSLDVEAADNILLAPIWQNSTNGTTSPLQVYFDSGSSLLVKLSSETGKRGPTYEIPRSFIQAIRWCG